jgi:hypothetical protein
MWAGITCYIRAIEATAILNGNAESDGNIVIGGEAGAIGTMMSGVDGAVMTMMYGEDVAGLTRM